MKIRQGFVSNSSSSSFVIAKSFLTKVQLGAIYDFHKEQGEDGSYWAEQEGCIQEDDNYISFNVHNVSQEFDDMCDKHSIDQRKMIFLEH